MRRSLVSIVGLGMVAAIFMAMMSMFYLERIPNKRDLDDLERELRREHGLYLSPTARLKMKLHFGEESEGTGLEIRCLLQPHLRRRPSIQDVYLDRMAESVLDHPDWRGRISWVTVIHEGHGRSRTKRARDRRRSDRKPAPTLPQPRPPAARKTAKPDAEKEAVKKAPVPGQEAAGAGEGAAGTEKEAAPGDGK